MMIKRDIPKPVKLSIVIPCFNEKNTLEQCVKKVMGIQDQLLSLEIIIVDDCSSDDSLAIAKELARRFTQITVLVHDTNRGKGAALQTGFQHATGEIVAVQDADLEYDPADLKRMIAPILNDDADVVFGTRFSTSGAHRVLYFWHSVGNKFLTLLSNMFSDLNLTDMECCYKVFRREIIQAINIRESRFGVEPELVAKVAQMRVRIFEMGISYSGRTYEEGKKIGFKDGFRALYCIFRYNAPKAPVPIQFLIYVFIGGISAAVNLGLFLLFQFWGMRIDLSIPFAYVLAASLNYLLCIAFLFRHKAKWNSTGELIIYTIVVCLVGLLDFGVTKFLLSMGTSAWLAKSVGCLIGLMFNFAGRRFFVFPEAAVGPWRSQFPLK
jgi:glycosyltransferase involved in cell wall biosynthesis